MRMLRALLAALCLVPWIAYGAVAYDATASSGAFANNPTWTHTPVGTPKAAIVFVLTTTSDTIGATYGGVSMANVGESPYSATVGGEVATARVQVFFLGSSVPTGAQTVAITGGSVGQVAQSYTLTAGGNVQFIDTSVVESAAVANPSVTVSLGGRTCWVAEVFTSGQDAVTGITPSASWTGDSEIDNGTVTAGFYRYNTIGTTDVAAGLTQTSDDILLIGAAFSEVVATTVVNPISGRGASAARPLAN